MVRGLIGNQVSGKLDCRFESCSLRNMKIKTLSNMMNIKNLEIKIEHLKTSQEVKKMIEEWDKRGINIRMAFIQIVYKDGEFVIFHDIQDDELV